MLACESFADKRVRRRLAGVSGETVRFNGGERTRTWRHLRHLSVPAGAASEEDDAPSEGDMEDVTLDCELDDVLIELNESFDPYRVDPSAGCQK